MPKKKVTGFCSQCLAQVAKGTRCEECRKKRIAQRQKLAYEEKKAAGICHKCTNPVVPGLTVCEKHRQKSKTPGFWREHHRNRKEEAKKTGRCITCMEKAAEPGKLYCCGCRAEQIAAMKRSNLRLREEVFAHYGLKCDCCPEDDIRFLTIDHPDNDGAEHRRKLKRSGGGNNLSVVKEEWISRWVSGALHELQLCPSMVGRVSPPDRCKASINNNSVSMIETDQRQGGRSDASANVRS